MKPFSREEEVPRFHLKRSDISKSSRKICGVSLHGVFWYSLCVCVCVFGLFCLFLVLFLIFFRVVFVLVVIFCRSVLMGALGSVSV